MKATKKWLNTYTPCLDVDTKKLEEIFTLTGTKVEEVKELYKMQNVVIGKILDIVKHENAEKLVVCKVDVKTEILQIVTGATNLKIGDIVPVAKHGAILPTGTEIKCGSLRGVDSCGMLCSAGELNLPLNFKKEQVPDGIMTLPEEYEKNVGEDFLKVFDIADSIFDFEITPNRQDCLGIIGIARELSCGLKREFKNPQIVKFEDFKRVTEYEDLKVKVETNDCYRYTSFVIDDLKNPILPEYIYERLNLFGITSKNALVDLTNYVMLETGQPLHAFDYEKLNGKLIIKDNENSAIVELLNDQKVEIKNDIVIKNDTEILALAGIIGSKNAMLKADSKKAVIEIANFRRKRLRDLARRINVFTDAYAKFEKKLPLNLVEVAFEKLVEYVEKFEVGKVRKEIINIQSDKQENVKVEIDFEKINNMLGIEVPKSEVLEILTRLEFKLINEKDEKIENEIEGKIFAISPKYRNDVSRVEDLAEEVIRFYGFDKLVSTLPTVMPLARRVNQKLINKNSIKMFLKSLGYNQIINYGFISDKDMQKVKISKEALIEVINPLSQDYNVMRSSAVPSILNTIKLNENRKNTDLKIYEIGKVYTDKENILNGNLPTEEDVLVMAMTNKKAKEKANYLENPIYIFKSQVIKLLNILGLPDVAVFQTNTNLMYHPGKYIEFKKGNDVIAMFGMINPKLNKEFDIKQEVYIFELNLEKVIKYAKKTAKFKEISKFPEVERDISMYVNKDVKYADIENVINKTNKKILENIKLFDIYEDEKLGDKKSIAIRLIFRDAKRTLQDSEVNEVIEKIIANLENKLGVEIRN